MELKRMKSSHLKGERMKKRQWKKNFKRKWDKDFPPLSSGENRPVGWCYQLDTVDGAKVPTNSVTIYSNPKLDHDESGCNGYFKFGVVTLTRAEVKEILKVLEEDIEEMRHYCPGHEFD